MSHQRGVPNQMLHGKKLLFHLVLGLVGVLTILYCTRWGAGLSDDSVRYISSAESLLRGEGYSHVTPLGEIKPTVQWPPLFSLMLTPVGAVGMSLFEAARWLNALLFGINITLVGYIVYRKTSFWPSIFASLIVLTSVDLIRLHAMAHSEALYFFLGLSGLYYLDKYINTSKKYPLVISALIISAATLTRFIGITLIATLCLSVLILGTRGLRQRMVDCFIAGLISSVPLLLWVTRNLVEGGHVSFVQNYQTHLPRAHHIKEGLETISLWLMPGRIPFSLRAVTVVTVALVMLLMMVWLRYSSALSFCYLNIIYVLIYILVHTLFITFVSLVLYYDARYLSPVLLSVVLILSLSMHRITLRTSRRVGLGIAVLCVLFSVYYVKRAVFVVNSLHQNGQGLEGLMWRQSKIISSIKKLPGDVRIYSNLPIAVHFLSQREIRDLPFKLDPPTEIPLPDYLRKTKEIGAASQSQRTVIIFVNWANRYYPSEDDLKEVLSLKEIETASEGSVYEVLH
jgi:hypothetical protein